MTTSFNRRQILTHAAAASALSALGASTATSAWAQQAARSPAHAKATKLASTLRIVIPANPGGGWDQTGRALGTALVGVGAADQIEYENIGGKGGTIGLAKYAEKYGNDANTLLMGGMVMVGAVALQKPAVDLTQIQPLARLTSDYLVAAVAAKSPIQNTKDLAEALRADLRSVPVAGGSAGGVDHIFAGVLARAAKASPENLVYKPFAGGSEVVDAVLSGSATVGLSGYSEFSDAIAAGKLRAIGVSSRRSVFGLPAFREQGLDAAMANWRGVFTGKGVAAARAAEMLNAVEAATGHESWQRTLKNNRWEPSWLAGKDLAEFMELDLTTARVMVYLLKLKA
ncbi:tripartite tricarboxylate transporter substrate binding protein [Acidovorax sp. sic0104]|uniref:Bug family tripartite tricarboxylate transporter substrate binding protein n=1 Tax=Acidovorax sp. sic0104 TaxID=2854784 RepID=UPI001C46F0BA|nr:tripartite tricarboxylate transporter substrate-binding protein [Acidovorax sp. sic0104]MBV7544092.1 tripartite tricarboxylate transporter substrate binding protein [Acidovorax sp. sic0104]